MNDTFRCGDRAAIVTYLYGECEASQRSAIAGHLAMCGDCAEELAGLESTRGELASWTPPNVALGFKIVGPQASGAGLREEPPIGTLSPKPGAWSREAFPAWMQLAAAVAIFAVGVWLGVARGRSVAEPARGQVAEPGTAGVSAVDFAALEQRLRAEIAEIRNASARSDAPPVSRNDAALLAQVRALIDDSEQRQQRELAIRTTQIVREFDSQRHADLTQIQRSFGQIEGLTGAEVREQREMLNYLMRVSQQAR